MVVGAIQASGFQLIYQRTPVLDALRNTLTGSVELALPTMAGSVSHVSRLTVAQNGAVTTAQLYPTTAFSPRTALPAYQGVSMVEQYPGRVVTFAIARTGISAVPSGANPSADSIWLHHPGDSAFGSGLSFALVYKELAQLQASVPANGAVVVFLLSALEHVVRAFRQVSGGYTLATTLDGPLLNALLGGVWPVPAPPPPVDQFVAYRTNIGTLYVDTRELPGATTLLSSSGSPGVLAHNFEIELSPELHFNYGWYWDNK